METDYANLMKEAEKVNPKIINNQKGLWGSVPFHMDKLIPAMKGVIEGYDDRVEGLKK